MKHFNAGRPMALLGVALITMLTVVSLNVAQAAVSEKKVEYRSGDHTFEGTVVAESTQSAAKRPGVLVVHDWMGATERTIQKARDLAGLGYVAFVADIYGKGVRPTEASAASKEATSYKKDRKLFRERLTLALEQLKAQPGVDGSRLAAIGYCFGGTGVLELARTGAALKGVVSFHGGLDSPAPADGKNIRAHVLALHGADDPFVAPADLAAFEDEMRKAGVDWQMVKYGGTVHSFTDKSSGTDNSKGAAYNESADRRSWLALKDFFRETL